MRYHFKTKTAEGRQQKSKEMHSKIHRMYHKVLGYKIQKGIGVTIGGANYEVTQRRVQVEGNTWHSV